MKPKLWAVWHEFVRICNMGLEPGDLHHSHIEGTFWSEKEARAVIAELEDFRKQLHAMDALSLPQEDSRVRYQINPKWHKGANLNYWVLHLALYRLKDSDLMPDEPHKITIMPFVKKS